MLLLAVLLPAVLLSGELLTAELLPAELLAAGLLTVLLLTADVVVAYVVVVEGWQRKGKKGRLWVLPLHRLAPFRGRTDCTGIKAQDRKLHADSR